MAFTLQQILDVLGADVHRVVGQGERTITTFAPIFEAQDDGAIVYCTAGRPDSLQLIRDTRAGVILCAPDVPLDELNESGKTFLIVENPRLAFLRLVKTLMPQQRPVGIHPTAQVDPDAKIGRDVYIGPFCSIGACEIGDGTVLHGYVHIYDAGVKIGRNCTIYAHTVIGTDGFGYGRNDEEALEFFPSIGGVMIEDDVDIHCYCNVDRGTLGNTVIGQGTKIDKYNHIGHNVKIGKNCLIMAQCVFSGGAVIGDSVTISICTAVRDLGIHIGDHAYIGMASVITKDVPPNTTVIGSPARQIDEYKRILEATKHIAGIEG